MGDARQQAWEQFKGLFRELARERSGEWLQADLTVPQYKALLLCYERARTVSELASELRVSVPTASDLAARLVAKGLLERRAGEEDRRRVWLALTEAGEELVARLHDARNAWLRRHFDGLPEEEAAALERGLRALIRSLRQERDE